MDSFVYDKAIAKVKEYVNNSPSSSSIFFETEELSSELEIPAKVISPDVVSSLRLSVKACVINFI